MPNEFLGGFDDGPGTPYGSNDLNPDLYDGLNQITDEIGGIDKSINAQLQRQMTSIQKKLQSLPTPIVTSPEQFQTYNTVGGVGQSGSSIGGGSVGKKWDTPVTPGSIKTLEKAGGQMYCLGPSGTMMPCDDTGIPIDGPPIDPPKDGPPFVEACKFLGASYVYYSTHPAPANSPCQSIFTSAGHWGITCTTDDLELVKVLYVQTGGFGAIIPICPPPVNVGEYPGSGGPSSSTGYPDKFECPPPQIINNVTCPPPQIVNNVKCPDITLIADKLTDINLKCPPPTVVNNNVNNNTCPPPTIINNIYVDTTKDDATGKKCEEECDSIEDETERKRCLEKCTTSNFKNHLDWMTTEAGMKQLNEYVDLFGYPKSNFQGDTPFALLNNLRNTMKIALTGNKYK